MKSVDYQKNFCIGLFYELCCINMTKEEKMAVLEIVNAMGKALRDEQQKVKFGDIEDEEGVWSIKSKVWVRD